MLRQGSECGDKGGKDEGKLPAFWKLFGGTVLSIAAMVVVTAHQSLSSSIADVRSETSALNNEMRKEIGRLAESQGELVKKEECDSRFKSVWRDVAELREDKKELIRLKQQCDELTKMREKSEEGRRQLAQDLRSLREEQVRRRERQALAMELAALRERLAGLEGKKVTQAAEAPASKVGRLRKALDAALAAVVEQAAGTASSVDANQRITELLNQSEDLPQIQEWIRMWVPGQSPQHLTYDRIHGGIQ
jgi:hypothetical protein